MALRQEKDRRWIPDKPPQCELRATGRVMVEVRIVINGVVQPVPPVWIPAQEQEKKQ